MITDAINELQELIDSRSYLSSIIIQKGVMKIETTVKPHNFFCNTTEKLIEFIDKMDAKNK